MLIYCTLYSVQFSVKYTCIQYTVYMCIVYYSWTPTLYCCCKWFSSFGVVLDSSLPYRYATCSEKEEEKNSKCIVVVKICLLVGFGRATRPCAACTRF
jgi:hypothetical protein